MITKWIYEAMTDGAMAAQTRNGGALIVLCVPNIGKRPTNTNRLYTLGMLYLKAAAHRAGWRARIVDAYFDDISQEQTVRRLADMAPDLIGYSVVSDGMMQAAAQAHDGLEKALGRPVPAVAGGHFATRREEHVFAAHPSMRWVIQGEGEVALEGLLRWVSGEAVSAEALPGLIDRHGVTVLRPVPKRTEPVLDRFGDYDEDWIETDIGPSEWSLVTSRGCTARCSFCVIGPHWGRYGQWRGHSAAWIAKRLRRLRDRGALRVQIVDDQFVGAPESIDRAWELCNLLSGDTGLPALTIMSRPDTVVDHPDLFAALRSIGLGTVFLGLETGNPDIAIRFRKEVGVDVGERAVAILDSLGLDVHSGTIVFHPWMTVDTLRADLSYFRGLMDKHPRFRILALNELDILPGTPLAALHGGNHAAWQHDWTDQTGPIAMIYRAWRAYQDGILFPALRDIRQSGQQFGAAVARLQLDALDAVIDAYCRQAPLDPVFIGLQARAVRVAHRFGQHGLSTSDPARPTGWMPQPGSPRQEQAERCFD